jgi:hypothetical protein
MHKLGYTNALSIALSLGGAGIKTYAINYHQALVRCSRFCKWIDVPKTAGTVQESWSVAIPSISEGNLLAASDGAIELIANIGSIFPGNFGVAC